MDRFDVVAELEAKGFNERLTRLHLDGRSLFEVGDMLFRRRPDSDVTRAVEASVTHDDTIDAVLRALVLVSGVVLVAYTFATLALGSGAIAVASFVAWVGGQSSSAVLWNRRGQGDLDGGLRAACTWAFAVFAATTLLAVATVSLWSASSALPALVAFIGMQAYAHGVAIITVTPHARPVGTGVVAGSVLVVAVGAMGAPAPVLLALVGVVLLAPTVVVIAAWARLPASGGFERRDAEPIPSALLQALVLAGGIVLLLGGPSPVDPVPFMAGSVTAIATTDPLLVVGRRRLQRLARTRWSRRMVARRGRVSAVGSCLAPAALAGLVAWAAGEWATPSTGFDVMTAVAAGGYVVLATFSSSLRTYGASWLAVGAALPVLAGAVALTVGATTWALVAVAAGVVAGAWMLSVRVGDPRSYL